MILRGRLTSLLHFLAEVYREYSRSGGGTLAASISFYVFVSVFPLVILGVAALGYVVKSPERAQELVTSFAGNYLGVTSHAARTLTTLLDEIVRGRGAATGLGFFSLLWSGGSALMSVEQAINTVWRISERRHCLRRWLVAIGMMICAGLLLLVSFGITMLANAIEQHGPRYFNIMLVDWNWLWSLHRYLAPLLITILMFSLIYKWLPNTFVRWRTAMLGGGFAGLLWEAAKVGFGYYVTHFAGYSRVYGSLAGVILLIVWIKYSATVTILGAVFAYLWPRRLNIANRADRH